MSNYLPAGLDFTGGAVFGTKRLVSGYAGKAFRLVRQSDSAVLDVPFLTDDTVDVAAIAAFIGASTAKCDIWYDQSGNGYDAAQTTNANRPDYQVSVYDTRPGLLTQNVALTENLFLNLPISVSQNVQSCGLFIVAKCQNRFVKPISSIPSIQIGTVPGGGGPTDGIVLIECQDVLTMRGNQSGATPVKVLNVVPADTIPETIGLVSTSTGVQVIAGNRKDAFISTAVPRFDSQLPTGGFLGQSYDFQSEGEFRAVIITKEPTVTLARQVCAVLNAAFTCPIEQTKALWWIGDSISSGYHTVGGINDCRDHAPGALLPTLRSDYFVRVWSFTGLRIDELDTNCSTGYSPYSPDSRVADYANSQCLIWGGTNDITNGDSLATMQARMIAIVANRKTAGFTKVYTGTIYDSGATAFNAWLKSGGAGDDGCIDFAGLGTWSMGAGTLLDTVHPSYPAGVQLAANIANSALTNLLASAQPGIYVPL